MSVSGDRQSENSEEPKTNICRDYMNNICNRGSHCKFYHPPMQKPKEEYNFCIDFQNNGCTRENCRFVHASAEDAENYKRVGDISLSLAHAIAVATQSDTVNGIPICKEFLKGICTREARCRFWHIDPRSEAPRSSGGGSYSAAPRPILNRYTPPNLPISGIKRHNGGYDAFDISAKRTAPTFGAFSTPPAAMARPDTFSQDRIMELERRNTELSVEVESLKRELQREKDRYADLLLIFRESNAAAVAAATVQQQKSMPPSSWSGVGSSRLAPPHPADRPYGW